MDKSLKGKVEVQAWALASALVQVQAGVSDLVKGPDTRKVAEVRVRVLVVAEVLVAAEVEVGVRVEAVAVAGVEAVAEVGGRSQVALAVDGGEDISGFCFCSFCSCSFYI